MKSWLKWGIGFSLIPILFYALIKIFYYGLFINPTSKLSLIILILWLFINIIPLWITNLLGMQSLFYLGYGFAISARIPGLILTIFFWFGIGVLVNWIIGKVRNRQPHYQPFQRA